MDAEGPRSRDALSPRGPGGCGMPAASLLSDIKGGGYDDRLGARKLAPEADGRRVETRRPELPDPRVW